MDTNSVKDEFERMPLENDNFNLIWDVDFRKNIFSIISKIPFVLIILKINIIEGLSLTRLNTYQG